MSLLRVREEVLNLKVGPAGRSRTSSSWRVVLCSLATMRCVNYFYLVAQMIQGKEQFPLGQQWVLGISYRNYLRKSQSWVLGLGVLVNKMLATLYPPMKGQKGSRAASCLTYSSSSNTKFQSKVLLSQTVMGTCFSYYPRQTLFFRAVLSFRFIDFSSYFRLKVCWLRTCLFFIEEGFFMPSKVCLLTGSLDLPFFLDLDLGLLIFYFLYFIDKNNLMVSGISLCLLTFISVATLLYLSSTLLLNMNHSVYQFKFNVFHSKKQHRLIQVSAACRACPKQTNRFIYLRFKCLGSKQFSMTVSSSLLQTQQDISIQECEFAKKYFYFRIIEDPLILSLEHHNLQYLSIDFSRGRYLKNLTDLLFTIHKQYYATLRHSQQPFEGGQDFIHLKLPGLFLTLRIYSGCPSRFQNRVNQEINFVSYCSNSIELLFSYSHNDEVKQINQQRLIQRAQFYGIHVHLTNFKNEAELLKAFKAQSRIDSKVIWLSSDILLDFSLEIDLNSFNIANLYDFFTENKVIIQYPSCLPINEQSGLYLKFARKGLFLTNKNVLSKLQQLKEDPQAAQKYYVISRNKNRLKCHYINFLDHLATEYYNNNIIKLREQLNFVGVRISDNKFLKAAKKHKASVNSELLKFDFEGSVPLDSVYNYSSKDTQVNSHFLNFWRQISYLKQQTPSLIISSQLNHFSFSKLAPFRRVRLQGKSRSQAYQELSSILKQNTLNYFWGLTLEMSNHTHIQFCIFFPHCLKMTYLSRQQITHLQRARQLLQHSMLVAPYFDVLFDGLRTHLLEFRLQSCQSDRKLLSLESICAEVIEGKIVGTGKLGVEYDMHIVFKNQKQHLEARGVLATQEGKLIEVRGSAQSFVSRRKEQNHYEVRLKFVAEGRGELPRVKKLKIVIWDNVYERNGDFLVMKDLHYTLKLFENINS